MHIPIHAANTQPSLEAFTEMLLARIRDAKSQGDGVHCSRLSSSDDKNAMNANVAGFALESGTLVKSGPHANPRLKVSQVSAASVPTEGALAHLL